MLNKYVAPLRWRKRPRPSFPGASYLASVGLAARLPEACRRASSSRARGPINPPRPRAEADGEDEYRWMHNDSSQEVRNHLKSETRYASANLWPLRDRTADLSRKLLSRQPAGLGSSVPERAGPYLYYTKHKEGLGFPLYMRRRAEGGESEGKEEVVSVVCESHL
ncbi:unnamed protein product [Discosporangium mesarthrocarpum]